MKYKVYIVSEETRCPLNSWIPHIENQTYFRNSEKAFDYFKNLVEHKCIELNYSYHYSGQPILFKELKKRFIMMESTMEIQLENKHNGTLWVKIAAEDIKTDSEL